PVKFFRQLRPAPVPIIVPGWPLSVSPVRIGTTTLSPTCACIQLRLNRCAARIVFERSFSRPSRRKDMFKHAATALAVLVALGGCSSSDQPAGAPAGANGQAAPAAAPG